MRKFLSSDIASRIISLVLAIVVWVYVVILIDPAIDIPINDIPVIYTNTVNLTNEDYVITNEKSTTVSIKIRGSRTRLAKIKPEDITAFIDLNGYNQTGSFSIPISVRLPYEEVSVVEKKPSSADVIIDKLVTQTFPVTVGITGKPSEGYEVYEPITSQNTINIKGPSDIVTSIERVVAKLDVSGASGDVISNQALTLYNTNEDVISNKFLTLSPEKLEVRCEILKKKTVPVKAILNDHEQRHMANVLTNSYITILARPDILDHINEINTKPIDVSGINDDTKITAQLDMPAGVATLEGITDATVDISVKK